MNSENLNQQTFPKPQVYLIGGGPGAVDLLTIRAERILKKAEIVFYDALISTDTLELCPQAKLVAVGKRAKCNSTRQNDINNLLISACKDYKCVVRLKGGDPLLFARAEEELSALFNAGINFEIVPGITALFAASAYLKQPLTLRGHSRSLTLTTTASAQNHHNDKLNFVDKFNESLVFYMGRDNAVNIGQSLITQGFSENTPVRVVSAVSTHYQQTILITLSELIVGKADVLFDYKHPCLLMVGKVFAKRNWMKD